MGADGEDYCVAGRDVSAMVCKDIKVKRRNHE